MEATKYIGMDVHKDSISIAVLNSAGKLVMECVIETKAITILEFVHGLGGSLHLTFEEGTWAAWLPAQDTHPWSPRCRFAIQARADRDGLMVDGS